MALQAMVLDRVELKLSGVFRKDSYRGSRHWRVVQPESRDSQSPHALGLSMAVQDRERILGNRMLEVEDGQDIESNRRLHLCEGPNLRCGAPDRLLTAFAQLLLHVSVGTFGGTRVFAFVYRAICLCVESAPPSNFFESSYGPDPIL